MRCTSKNAAYLRALGTNLEELDRVAVGVGHGVATGVIVAPIGGDGNA